MGSPSTALSSAEKLLPKYHELMRPLLQLCSDRRQHSAREAAMAISQQLSLTEEQLKEMLPSGQQTIFENRLGWARTYLTKAGMLEKVGRGIFCITTRGQQLLDSQSGHITKKDLEQYSDFFTGGKANSENPMSDVSTEAPPTNEEEEEFTPEESLELGYQKLRRALAIDVIERVKQCSPAFFERLVVELLLKMGYGGSRRDAGEAIGKSGDGGIDGIIKEDRLGLDSVYIQAKRWDETSVGRPEVQKFAGALQMHRARKGIFITTSKFSNDAYEYVKVIDSRIVLIDGPKLAQLMMDFNVGVSPDKTYEVKRLDSDYFDE